MNADEYQKLKEIYNSVVELKPEDRAAFLDENCPSGNGLRSEVDRLLASCDSEFLETPVEFANGEADSVCWSGRRIGHYSVLNKIGSGGMGDVYLALDGKLGRRVAIKVLPEEFTTDQDRLDRFQLEARAASSLSHPSILTIYDIGDWEGVHYIATEYVEGETLRQRLARERLSVGESVGLGIQIISAITAAHAAGICHRDIKPENIMIREDGLVKMVDFGLVKLTRAAFTANFSPAAHDESTVRIVNTEPGVIMGTVQYMSPEQTRGHATDERSDIWGLGCVLYEMLAGFPPFTGENSADLIAEIVKAQPAPPSSFDGRIPARLDEVVAKTLEKNPDLRYQSAIDLLDDVSVLKRKLDAESEIERSDVRIGVPDKSVRKARTGSNVTQRTLEDVSSVKFILAGMQLHKRTAFAIFALIAASLGGTAYVARTYWRSPDNGSGADLFDSLRSVRLASWTSGSGSPYTVYRASHNGTMIAYSSTQDGDGEGIFVKQTADGEEIRVTKDKWQNHNPLWSPDDQRIAFVSRRENQNGIYVCPSFGGTSIALKLLGEDNVYLRHWSLDGSAIFYEVNGNLYRLDLETREAARVTNFPESPGRVRYFSVAPNEDLIAFCEKTDTQDDIWVMPAAGGEPRRITNDKDEEINPRWHPDGKRILFNVYRGDFSQINLAHVDGRPPDQVTRGEGRYELIDVSADGTKIFYLTWEKQSARSGANTETGEGFDLSTDVNSEFWTEVSPDGKFVVFQTNPAPHLTTYLHESSFLIKSLADESAQLSMKGFNPRWLPDGRGVSFVRWDAANQKYDLWMVDAASGREVQISTNGVSPPSTSMMPINRGEIGESHFSAQRNSFVYLDSKRQNVYAATLDQGELSDLTGNRDPGVRYFSPLWSPGGDRIVYISMERAPEKPPRSIWRVWIYEQGQSKNILSTGASLRLLGWSKTGGDLLFATTVGPMKSSPLEVQLMQISLTGDQFVRATYKNVYASSLAVSVDGKSVAFVARNNNRDNVWVAPVRGQPKRITTNTSTRIFFGSPAWSPDGKTIYFDKQEAINTISMFENFR